jgi:uncharacterized protein DUF4232
MKKLILIIILLIIIAFTAAGYFFIVHFQKPNAPIKQTPSAMVSQTQSQFCQTNQLSGDVMTQGGAGNIYATLTLTNSGKTACTVVLGNTVKVTFNAKNIVTNYKKNAPSQNFMLAPGGKVYSQIHYPNGPQCQSPIKEVPITFLYKTDQTSVTFQPNSLSLKLSIQACSSETEKTIVDIWPLSKNPITQ